MASAVASVSSDVSPGELRLVDELFEINRVAAPPSGPGGGTTASDTLTAGGGLSQPTLAPTDSAQSVEQLTRDVIVPRPSIELSERRVTLQRFEGTVQSVEGDEFSGALFDLTDTTRLEEVVAFSIDEVSEQDRGLVSPGSVFYWFIGYDVSRSGQLTRTSRIRFRRLPAWTPSRLRMLRTQAAQEFADIFKPADAI